MLWPTGGGTGEGRIPIRPLSELVPAWWMTISALVYNDMKDLHLTRVVLFYSVC